MNPTISVLVVGVGSIGERHLRCFAATGRARLSFCEPNATVRQTIAERYQINQVFDDLTPALASRPEAVVICTPANLHVPIATAAAQAGADVLIEKPLSTSLQGVGELQELINQRQLAAAVAYVLRAHPALIAMRNAIREGRFGVPLQVVATSGQPFPLYRPAYRDTYYKDRAAGGGAVQDALTHTLNAAEWLVGPIDRLVADVDHKALAGVTTEDTAHVIARHGHIMSCFSLNQHQAPNESTLTVICERGTARFEYHNSRWRWVTTPGGNWHDEPASVERDTLFVHQAEMFLQYVEGAGRPLCSLDEAVQTLRVNLAVLASAETGSWQTVNQETMGQAQEDQKRIPPAILIERQV